MPLNGKYYNPAKSKNQMMENAKIFNEVNEVRERNVTAIMEEEAVRKITEIYDNCLK